MAGLEVYVTDQTYQFLPKVLTLQSFSGRRITSTSFPAKHMKQDSEIKPARIIFQILLWRRSSTIQRCRKAVVFSIAKTDISQKSGKGCSPKAVISAFQSTGLLVVEPPNSKTSLQYHFMYSVILQADAPPWLSAISEIPIFIHMDTKQPQVSSSLSTAVCHSSMNLMVALGTAEVSEITHSKITMAKATVPLWKQYTSAMPI